MERTTWIDGMRKGEWSEEEDKKLVAYINEHGVGKWCALPMRAGLQRCGKSCRSRWLNYLKPGIKIGKFTSLEEEEIIRLHALHGNKWSSIAKHIPNRTGHKIKNHWNSCLKKRLSKKGIDPMTHKPKILTDEVTLPSPSFVSSSSSTGTARLLNKLATEISKKHDMDKIKNVIFSEQKRMEIARDMPLRVYVRSRGNKKETKDKVAAIRKEDMSNSKASLETNGKIAGKDKVQEAM